MRNRVFFLTCMPVIFFCLAVAFPHAAQAAWSGDPAVNTPVSVDYGADWHPKILKDGGGAIIAWERDGVVYAQKVDADGNLLWAENGVAVSSGGDCRLPQLASDGAGGAIFAWLDYETGIYAQRIGSNGAPVWTDVVAVAEPTLPLAIIGSPSIASDEAGGAIIAWMDYRTESQSIYSQRINSAGVAQWTTNGVSVSSLPACSQYPMIVADGSHGAIIAWNYSSPYCSGSGSYYDIYAQRVDADGAVQWGSTGVAVCTAASNQYLSDTESDGNGGAILAWYDMRTPSNSYDIYAQKVNFGGVPQWTADGVGVCVAGPAPQTNPVIASDGAGGAYVSWVDNRTSPVSIFAQRLDLTGTPQWTSNGIIISDYTFNNAGGLNMTEDGSGGAIIGWIDGHAVAGYGLLAAQKVNAGGTLQWPAGGAAVSTAHTAFDIGVVNDGNGGAIFTWYDGRNDATTGLDIFAQKVSAGGALPGLPPSVTTAAISAITDTTATSGGNVTADGGDAVTARGVCWGSSVNPEATGSHTTDGSGTGIFTSAISGLTALTSYHVRAYATNSGGTAYGEDISFTTNLCTVDVQRGETSFGTIQEALSSGSGPEIKAVARLFTENLSFTTSGDLTLSGGWACGLGSISGVTAIHGSMTIAGSGGVTVSNLAVY
jgi:hypothetical protein